MLLKRYSDINYVLKLPLKRAIKLLNKAQEEETKEYYYRTWLARYPLYTEKTYESFIEYYEKCNPVKIKYDVRSTDDIMLEMTKVEESFKKGDGKT